MRPLSAGAPPSRGTGAVHAAARSDKPSALRVLITEGRLAAAAGSDGDEGSVEMLAGIAAPPDGACPLHWAAAAGSLRAVRLLLDLAPGLVSARTLRGETPLMFAAGSTAEGSLECARALLEAGEPPYVTS